MVGSLKRAGLHSQGHPLYTWRPWHRHGIPMPPSPQSTAPCKANAAAPGLIGLQAQWASTVGQNAVLTTGVFRDVAEPQKAGSGEPENSPEMVFGSWFCRGKCGKSIGNLCVVLFFACFQQQMLRNYPWQWSDHLLRDASPLSADSAWFIRSPSQCLVSTQRYPGQVRV